MKYELNERGVFLKDRNYILAELDYKKINDDTYDIYHTYVDESLRKKGIASKLVEKAYEYIKNNNCNVIASCSYAKKWLEENSKK